MKKFLLGLLFSVALLGLLHKPLLGACLRYFVYYKTGVVLAYRAAEWGEKAFVLKDVALFDEKLHAQVEEVRIEKEKVIFVRPAVTAFELKSFEGSGSGITIEVVDGTIDWGGRAHFDFEGGALSVVWEESSLDVVFRDGMIEADLDRFQLSRVRNFLPFDVAGIATGRIVFDEGPKLINLDLEDTSIVLDGASLSAVSGEISYNVDLGAKWELKGLGDEKAFRCEGRGFFKSRWIESALFFEEGFCKVSGEEVWSLECKNLSAKNVSLLQSAVKIWVPEAGKLTLTNGTISGAGFWSTKGWDAKFQGSNLQSGTILVENIDAHLNPQGSTVFVKSGKYDVDIAGTFDDWKCTTQGFACSGSRYTIQKVEGEIEGISFAGKGTFDLKGNLHLALLGTVSRFGQVLPFSLPVLDRKEGVWHFDFRATSSMWDKARLTGTFTDAFHFTAPSHLLGRPIVFEENAASVALKAKDLPNAWQFGDVALRLGWGDAWTLDVISDLALHIAYDEKLSGKFAWQGAEAHFEGTISPDLECDFAISDLVFDLGQVSVAKGRAAGQGHVSFAKTWEADFDLGIPRVEFQGKIFENEGMFHVHATPDKAEITGLNAHGDVSCSADLVELTDTWKVFGADLYLQNYAFHGCLEVARDFSWVQGRMKEALVEYPITDVDVLWSKEKWEGSFRYLGNLCQFFLKGNDGRVILGEEATPMTVDFSYTDELTIHSIVGCFAGLDASFHRDEAHSLIGSSHVDFQKIKPFIPKKVADAFTDLKMGKGYELKGRLYLEKNQPSFHGVLSGKQLELFGFQFRTLLAQVDLHDAFVRLFDLKISDSAGQMQVGEVLLQGGDSWTLSIPELYISEFRPSLLQKIGGGPGEISPLVVRELHLRDLKGLADEPKTYTASGDLRFINSYKREETVFDVPANMLSRIVGLDFELMIPVTGDLTFDVKDGYFDLLELTNSFSEAGRSEFFLETEPKPRMDFAGNLEIWIKMKQFVLLKLTESFLIAVDGNLDEPEFHLKKRRMYGLSL